METTNGMVRGTKGISIEGILKGKELVWEEKSWVLPIKYGMEVEPNISGLGVIVDITIVPPP